MQIRFLGSGDAFGSGGRFQTCILVAATSTRFLIDCGASSLVAMRRFGVDPNEIDAVLLSHLHGDHFGGLPFFLLDAQLVSRRVRPLVIAGPPGTKARTAEAMEVFFPGSSGAAFRFASQTIELEPDSPAAVGGLRVTPYVVRHPSGAPALALRIECDGKTIAYSGDTEWTDALISAAADADLFIAEAYWFERKIRYHLDFQTLRAHLGELRARRVIVTHMSEEMLGRAEPLGCERAEDGMVIVL